MSNYEWMIYMVYTDEILDKQDILLNVHFLETEQAISTLIYIQQIFTYNIETFSHFATITGHNKL